MRPVRRGAPSRPPVCVKYARVKPPGSGEHAVSGHRFASGTVCSSSRRHPAWVAYHFEVTRTAYLATCAALPGGDEADGAALLAACTRAGLDASWQVWDDPAVDWAAADLVVVRATWDYSARRREFLAWAAAVPRLANPAAVLSWNSDKRYLADLAAAGVPVVPTDWAEPGEDARLPGSGYFVVKPSVGAGSMGAARFAADDPAASAWARTHIGTLHAAGRTAMVQPYLADVDAAGETALVFLDGAYSHAVRKGPMLAEAVVNGLDGASLYVAESIAPRTPDAREREVAEAALAAAPADLLYARVDLLPTAAGPVLIELELTEPSLYLGYREGAADRFAAAISARSA